MKMFEGKLIFKGRTGLDQLKKMLSYYGSDVTVQDIISMNLTPNQQYVLRDSQRMYKKIF